MFRLSPSDADLYWYAGKLVFVAGIIYVSAFALGFDPMPSSSADFLVGLWLLALVPAIEDASESTPLYEELELGDG